jgi:hypothetical protein
MRLRERIEDLVETQVAELAASGEFRALESGSATPAAYDQFVADVVRTHLKVIEYVAFLCALAAPATSESRLRNLLEEIHHPGLLRGAGPGDRAAWIPGVHGAPGPSGRTSIRPGGSPPLC